KFLTALAVAASASARSRCMVATRSACLARTACHKADQGSQHKHHRKSAYSCDQRAISLSEFSSPVCRRAWGSQHWLTFQIPRKIGRELGRRSVTARAILFETLQGNGIQVTAQLFSKRHQLRAAVPGRKRRVFAQGTQLGAGFWCIFFP